MTLEQTQSALVARPCQVPQQEALTTVMRRKLTPSPHCPANTLSNISCARPTSTVGWGKAGPLVREGRPELQVIARLSRSESQGTCAGDGATPSTSVSTRRPAHLNAVPLRLFARPPVIIMGMIGAW